MHVQSRTFALAAFLRALAEVLLSASQELRGLARRVEKSLAAREEKRVALEQLGEMSDRELRDIGLDRANIRAAAGGTFRRDIDSRPSVF